MPTPLQASRLIRSILRSAAGRIVVHSLRDLRNLELLDRAMTLAAQAFTSILPILIVTGSLRRSANPDADSLIADSLSLDQRTAELLQRSMPEPVEGITFTQIVNVLLLLIAATAFTRALERCFRKIWNTPTVGLRFAWRWVAAIIAIVIGLVLIITTRSVVRGTGAVSVLQFTLEAALWCLLWWIASWLVTNRHLSLQALLPGSVLAGLGIAAVTAVGRVYLPSVLAASAQEFGVLGLAFSYIGWLFVLMTVLLASATVGRVVHLLRIGRLWSHSGEGGAAPAVANGRH